ncbi:hypothetical protein HFK83_03220 [Ralstonia pseudosolanacearum]|uniref:hypothetical protein n=1 Tax=Ralstonia pseudosolanacearum TaxID=1310165 RepID=UPI002003DBD3|nr:hypothetical protein [Ralstonia pseudosolanacearum]MCK4121382.1 hypothetical protein [Ralstonia pseudosolanacearum]
MNAKELAAQLTGAVYPLYVSKELAKAAKESGLVIVYGASDDLMEFAGAVDDELGAYDGTTAHLDAKGLLKNDCENDECPHFEKLKGSAATIEACWCATLDGAEYSWSYKTAIPHETFEIVEDGEPYCRGIVFALSDVEVAV